MSDHPHSHHELARAPAAETPLDAGSQALSEALRSSFGIVKFVMVLLVCIFLGSGFFTVGPQERAMIIRLGKPLGTGEKALLGPGLHWSLPYPIDDHIKVPITSVQRVTSTVGWYATTPEQEQAGTELPSLPVSTPINAVVDGYVLTADKNIVHARATLNYHIADPVGFVFNFVNASNMVQSAVDNALLSAASVFKVDDILTRDVAGFKEAVKKRVIEKVEHQRLGIVVEECQVQPRAPRQLKEAFDNVLRAENMRQKALNEARSFENQVTNRASAEAQSRINAAESERVRLVRDLNSQAERFNELLPKYRQNPELFAQQRLTETLARVFTNAQEKIFISEGPAGKPRQFRGLFNREPPKKVIEEPKPQS
jgi:modulator of FtsH protease HflK